MNCRDARTQLPLLAYGDLPPDEAAALNRHLADCPACQGEYAGLAQIRHALDVMPVPPVAVDVAALFAQSAARQVRRWRRLALAGAALAAALLVAFGLKLHVHAGNGHIVIAWGAPTEPPNRAGSVSDEKPNPVAHASGSDSLEERLQLLQELTHALARDIEARERRQQRESDILRTRLDGLQRAVAQRWAEAERMFSALYVAQFKRPEEGLNR